MFTNNSQEGNCTKLKTRANIEQRVMDDLMRDNQIEELADIIKIANGGGVKATMATGNFRKPCSKIDSENIQQSVRDAYKKLCKSGGTIAEKLIPKCEAILDKFDEKTADYQATSINVTKDTNLGMGSVNCFIPTAMTNQYQTLGYENQQIISNGNKRIVSNSGNQFVDKKNDVHQVERYEKNRKPNPAQVAEKLMGRYRFSLYKESVYVFCNNYYKLFTQTEICRVINADCKEEVRASGTSKFLTEVYNFIFHELSIIQQDACFDQIHHLIAFKNGYYNVMTGIFYPPDPKYFFMHCINIEYYSSYSGECYNFEKFLCTIANENQLLTRRIWEMLGYIFSNDTQGKAFFLLQGISNSGKSTLGDFISSFFPEEAQTSLSLDELANNFAVGNLHGKAICTDLELSAGVISEKAIGKLKNITGNDLITADVKFKARVKFKNRSKVIFASNHPFVMSTEDCALLNRLVVIPFNVSIPRNAFNYNLIASFENERLAIVKKAIVHYRQLVVNQYIFSGDFQANGNESFCKQEKIIPIVDNIALIEKFVTSCCIMTSHENYSFTVDLYNQYESFYKDEPVAIVDIKLFSEILNREYQDFVIKDRKRKPNSKNPESCYFGILLKVM